jgi:hypothetical protein
MRSYFFAEKGSVTCSGGGINIGSYGSFGGYSAGSWSGSNIDVRVNARPITGTVRLINPTDPDSDVDIGGATQYHTDDTQPGLLSQISEDALADTDVYAFRRSDGAFVGEAWSIIRMEEGEPRFFLWIPHRHSGRHSPTDQPGTAAGIGDFADLDLIVINRRTGYLGRLNGAQVVIPPFLVALRSRA